MTKQGQKKRASAHDIICAAYIEPRNITTDGRKRPKNARNANASIFTWGVCFCDNLAYHGGENLETLFLMLSRYAPLMVYVHDLDTVGKFILQYLFETGFTFSESNNLTPNTFNTMISGAGVIYKICVCLRYGNTGRKRIVHFRNINQKIQGTITEMATACGISYMPHKIQSHNETPDANDMAATRNRAEILAKSFQPIIALDWRQLTAGSDIMDAYKKYIGRKFYREIFPIIDEIDNEKMRPAYFGGIVHINPKYIGKSIEKYTYVYDINSAYIYAMCNCDQPYGQPIPFHGRPNPTKDTPLFIVSVSVSCCTKYGRLPTLIKNEPLSTKLHYISDTHGIEFNTTLTNIDLQLLYENYEIETITFGNGFYFHSSNNLFNDFLLPIYNKKQAARGALRQTYKKPLVAFYGKFGRRTEYEQIIPTFENGVLSFKMFKKNNVEPEYLPVSIFTAAYVRAILIAAINKNNQKFIYADTDSMHLTAPADFIKIDNNALGAWKLEKTFVRAKYLGQKMYFGIEKNGNEKIVIAGAQADVKLRVHYDNFNTGEYFDGNMFRMFCPHGLVSVNRTFRLTGRPASIIEL